MNKKIRAALLSLGGTAVAVVQVPSYVVHNNTEANRLISRYGQMFPGASIVLAALTGNRPNYYGVPSLIAALRRTPPFHIHWRDYDVTRPTEAADESSDLDPSPRKLPGNDHRTNTDPDS